MQGEIHQAIQVEPTKLIALQELTLEQLPQKHDLFETAMVQYPQRARREQARLVEQEVLEQQHQPQDQQEQHVPAQRIVLQDRQQDLQPQDQVAVQDQEEEDQPYVKEINLHLTKILKHLNENTTYFFFWPNLIWLYSCPRFN